MMYDISIDDFRPVTQQDVDMFASVLATYGQLRRYIKEMEREHHKLVANIKAAADELEKKAKAL